MPELIPCQDEVLRITKELVQTQSIVNTHGEKVMAEKLYALLADLPYFKAHPEQLLLEQTLDDDQERYNVLALVQGTQISNNPSSRTIILMGHLDTVGVDDFNQLMSLACQPDELMSALKQENLPDSVRNQLQSGEYLFGRGALDMKAGVASHIYLLKYYAEHPEKLNGNLLLVAECDEEDSSHGILSALKTLKVWRKTFDLEYRAAINADFVSPRFKGDENRYIYKGTVGKLLPSFFITGAETHVGSAFEGLDPNLIAAELTRLIDYNPKLCNEAFGETTVPPVSLKQTDLKPSYTVQTALSAYVYYNFFIHSWSPKDVLIQLKKVAQTAFENALDQFTKRYQTFCDISGEPCHAIPWEPRVFTYEEFNQLLLNEQGTAYKDHMEEFKQSLLQDQTLDTRMYAARVVEEAWKWMKDKRPAIILFYSSLYSPRIEVTGKNALENQLIQALDQAVDFVQPFYPHPIVTRNFFPYISDMSFVALSDDEEGIRAVSENNPSWGSKHYVNYEDIRDINVPVICIGPYGFDAHKKYERLEIKYSLEIVPNLINQVICRLLSSNT